MDSPTFSLIFVNYQSASLLPEALQALFSHERDQRQFEVIIVNNDLSEHSALEALKTSFPVRVIHAPRNGGYGYGANRGAAQAKGRYIGFLNPDTLWSRTMLTEIMELFQSKQDSCLVGLALVDNQGKEEPESYGPAPRFGRLVRKYCSVSSLSRASAPLPLDWVSGAGFFIPRAAFMKIGGFDERFFLYFEDVDLCVRAKKQGLTILRDARFSLVHYGGKSFASEKEQKAYFYRSQMRYYRKHRPWWEWILVWLFHAVVH